jgi:hypothetical protein
MAEAGRRRVTVLHAEQMRRQRDAVPRVRCEDRRGDG